MAYQTWLADVLRAAGLAVREIPDWRTRGHGSFVASGVAGVICHHTAGPATGLYPSENVVVNGRAGLPGPLANLGLDRAGTWIVVAAGQAWHAGTGSALFCPADQGNSYCLGVEAESKGTVDDWTPAQRTNYPRGVAALLKHLNLPASRVIGHKEWAPGRKVDPAFWDMNAFRADVARWMTNTASGGGIFMALTDAEQREILDGIRKLKPGVVLPARSPNAVPKQDDVFGAALNAWAEAANARASAERIESFLRTFTGGTGAPAALTPADRTAIATEVANLLAARLAQ